MTETSDSEGHGYREVVVNARDQRGKLRVRKNPNFYTKVYTLSFLYKQNNSYIFFI